MNTQTASVLPILAILALLGSPAHLAAAAPELKEVQNLFLPELRSVTSVVISHDGKFAYAASFAANTVTTFKRDTATGQLELNDIISDHPALRSVVNFCLSKDEKYAAACAFGSNALTLFKRDPETGDLSIVDAAYESAGPNRGLNFVVGACFSPTADFIYTGCSEGVGVYEIKGDKLHFVQSTDADGKLSGVRGLALSPNGEWVYATAMTSGNLGVFRRDPSGLVSAAQVLSNAESGTKSLTGAFHCVVSADGKFVYVNSGRFRGDQAVSAFAVAEDGQLKVLQEFVDGTGDFTEFQGGNSLTLSPDGKTLVALATLSDRLFRFERDVPSGKLTFVGSQLVGQVVQPGSAGLCFSPDGRFLYVADESASAIVAYEIPQ